MLALGIEDVGLVTHLGWEAKGDGLLLPTPAQGEFEPGFLEAVGAEVLASVDDAVDSEAVILGEELDLVENLVDVVGIGRPALGLLNLPGLVLGFAEDPGVVFSEEVTFNAEVIS